MNEIKKEEHNNFNEVAVIASQQTQGRGRRNTIGFLIKEIIIYQLGLNKNSKKFFILLLM